MRAPSLPLAVLLLVACPAISLGRPEEPARADASDEAPPLEPPECAGFSERARTPVGLETALNELGSPGVACTLGLFGSDESLETGGRDDVGVGEVCALADGAASSAVRCARRQVLGSLQVVRLDIGSRAAYFVYERDGSAWRILGTARSFEIQGEMTPVRVERLGAGATFLVTSSRFDSDSGMGLTETWFDLGERLDNGMLAEKLTVMREGSSCGRVPLVDREWSSVIVGRSGGTTPALVVDVSARHLAVVDPGMIDACNGTGEIEVFRTRARVRYEWEGEERRFVAPNDGEAVARAIVGEQSYAMFLERVEPHLRRIAEHGPRGSIAAARDFLERFCAPDAECAASVPYARITKVFALLPPSPLPPMEQSVER